MDAELDADTDAKWHRAGVSERHRGDMDVRVVGLDLYVNGRGNDQAVE